MLRGGIRRRPRLLPPPRLIGRALAVTAAGLLGWAAWAYEPGALGRAGGMVARPAVPLPPGPGTRAELPKASPTGRGSLRPPLTATPVSWRASVAVGRPEAGRLVRGVKLPYEGRHYYTWDPVEKRRPNRSWRRHGTDRLVRVLLAVATRHRAGHPGAPRVSIGDLSRPRGGDFGVRYGIVGHATHQNGLDADVYYPRRDRRERAPRSFGQVDRRLAQDLVERFVAAGAERVFVGPATGLRGPPGVVVVIPNHDDHLHVRIPPEAGG